MADYAHRLGLSVIAINQKYTLPLTYVPAVIHRGLKLISVIVVKIELDHLLANNPELCRVNRRCSLMKVPSLHCHRWWLSLCGGAAFAYPE